MKVTFNIKELNDFLTHDCNNNKHVFPAKQVILLNELIRQLPKVLFDGIESFTYDTIGTYEVVLKGREKHFYAIEVFELYRDMMNYLEDLTK
jgi:hypothetical protein